MSETLSKSESAAELTEKQQAFRRYIIDLLGADCEVNYDIVHQVMLDEGERQFCQRYHDKSIQGELISEDEQRSMKQLEIKMGFTPTSEDLKFQNDMGDDYLSRKIWAQRNFVAIPECITPEKITGDESDDVAAVVAKTKPAAILRSSVINPSVIQLINRAYDQGLAVENIETGGKGYKLLSVGEPWRVDRLKQIFETPRAKENYTLSEHNEIGQLLGYPLEAIEKMLDDQVLKYAKVE